MKSLPFIEDDYNEENRAKDSIFVMNKSSLYLNQSDHLPKRNRIINFSVIDYISVSLCKRVRKDKNEIFNKLNSYKNHYKKRLNVVKYIELHNEVKVLKNVLLSEENKLLFKLITPVLSNKTSDYLNKYDKIKKKLILFNNTKLISDIDVVGKGLLNAIDSNTQKLIFGTNINKK